jgi:hypothetical protein
MKTEHTRLASSLHAKGRGFRTLLSMSWFAGATLAFMLFMTGVGLAANSDGNGTAVGIPNDYTVVPHNSSTTIVDGLGTLSYSDDGNFGFNPSEFPETVGLPRLYKIKMPD